MVEVKTTKLENVLVFKPNVFRDFRGIYLETFNERDYREAIKEKTGHDVAFVQDSMSRSFRNVLRGIHGDSETWKLITCPRGRIYVAIVDCRENKETFGKWQAFDLSEEDMTQVLVPPNFGTSHIVLSDWALFQYKQSTYYDPTQTKLRQFTHKYDDSRFKIWWPIKEPILSQRDEQANTSLIAKSS